MEEVSENKAIVLVGLKHCGKSSVARQLAPFIGKTVIDTDECIARLVTPLLPQPTSDTPLNYADTVRLYFRTFGQEAFKDQEADVCEYLSKNERFSKTIIATGGGTMENQRAISSLARNSLVLFLDVPEDVLWTRVSRGGIPPFLETENPRESFHQLFVRRRSIAQHIAHCTVATGQEPIEYVVALVLKQIKEQTHAR